jgi:hypothetical protein
MSGMILAYVDNFIYIKKIHKIRQRISDLRGFGNLEGLCFRKGEDFC